MQLAERVLAGDVRAASRLIRNLEDGVPEAKDEIKKIFSFTGKAHIVGITGSPGAGKSTLVDALIAVFRKRNKTVGVLAVDPSSPFTGGAILGDRIRMQRHALDEGVFMRSLATRGSLGGLSRAITDAIHVVDALGKDIILVETVGAGQHEVDIINHAHTTLVVLVPGMGDEIQAIKAGILEIADIFVINKCDREGAEKLNLELSTMLDMASSFTGGWRPPVVMTQALFEKGIEDLADKIELHREHLTSANLMADRARRQARLELTEALRYYILDPVLKDLAAGEMDRLIEELVSRRSDPYTLAEQVARKYLNGYNNA